MSILLWIIALVLIVAYGRQIFTYRNGIDRLIDRRPTQKESLPNLTVVVPFRNELGSWERFCYAASRQDFHASVTYLFIDDHSSDEGSRELQEKAKYYELDFRVLHLPAGREGKKHAVHLGFEQADTPWVICTDADTAPEPTWLSEMARFLSPDKVLVGGPVRFAPARRPRHRYMALEFGSLIASAGGSIGIGDALMVNGANMAVRKPFFMSVWKGRADLDIMSGDDLFLLHEAKAKPESIDFVWSSKAMVNTPPPESYSEWWRQRRRWAAKASHYSDGGAQMASWTVLLFNLFIVGVFIPGVQRGHWYGAWWWTLAAKFIIDYPMLQRFADLDGKKLSMTDAIATAILYPFAIVGTAIHSQLGNVKWKGREGKA
ncbi:MAG: glycosyltransferase [Flavobacteriales bacterium]|nr:glycosyltransferase [Flavobacteriales bacterium]